MLRNPLKINTRLILMIGSALVLSGLFTLTVLYYSMKQDAINEAKERAKIILERNLATHTYFSHRLKPDVFKLTDTFLEQDFFQPSWMSSTYAVREIDKYYRSLNNSNYYYKECAINARSAENEADAYEAAFIKKMNSNPEVQIQSDIRMINQEAYFTVLRRGEVMEKVCLRCHNTPEEAPDGLVNIYGSTRSFNREVGEVVSAISIRVPIEVAFERNKTLTAGLTIIFLLTLFFVFTIQFWFNRKYILSPLNQIRQKAHQISNDETKLGEVIPYSKSTELNSLIESFNNMSAQLSEDRDLLIARVEERTIELSDANENLKNEIEIRKKMEEKIKANLKEKETFLKEIHHRVKNNMAVVSSLLMLQEKRIDDESTKDVLKEIQNRVFTMTAVHEMLYNSKDLTVVDLKSYFGKIADSLIESFAINPGKIAFKLESESEYLNISVKKASTLGLVFNEILSNALKHAFPNDSSGKIIVKLNKQEQVLRLTIEDNGIGMSNRDEKLKTNSLGMNLIYTLVENQLGGTIKLEADMGAKYIIQLTLNND